MNERMSAGPTKDKIICKTTTLNIAGETNTFVII